MQLTVLDSSGVAQKIIVHGQEALVDKSGSITSTGVAQDAIVANANRNGWFIQNVGLNPMYVNDLIAAAVGTAFIVPPNGVFPPSGYPVNTHVISILGTAGDKFVAREW